MNIPDRIYAQYRNKPKAVDWFDIARKLGGDLESAALAVRKSYSIEDSSGEQLSVIGRIVVADRGFLGQTELFPGMFDLLDGDQFGDDAAMFSGLSIDTESEMSDNLYRLVIKSKIAKNNGDATIEQILDGANFLLPNADVLRVVDGENMTFSIEFYGQITDLERWALTNANLISKPQGVMFNGFLEGHRYVEFGDDTIEFGDDEAQFVGFIGV